MVWRGNIKVLDSKTMALPLLVSLLMHGVMAFAFGAVKHSSKEVFMVELMFQSAGKGIQMKQGVSEKIDKMQRDRTVDKRTPEYITQNLQPVQNSESTTHEVKTQITVPKESNTLSTANEGHARTPANTITAPAGGTSGGDKSPIQISSDGRGTSARGSGKNVIDTEFGSSNGPSFLKRIKPDYPRLARRLVKEGKVVLRLFIDDHGRLVSVELIEKAGYGFDEAAMDAAKASSFQPAKLNGNPVACTAVLPVRFRLE